MKIKKTVNFSTYFLTLLLLHHISPGALLAQDASSPLSVEGIAGDIDDGRRSPVLTFSTEVAADGSSARILADTQIINEEFKKYPLSVDFFVNGKLFSRQFRSLELPAPLGIDVPKELAPIPFNYAIVATLLHPNRQYVTVAQGAVTADSSSSALQCSVEQSGTGSVSISGTTENSIGSDNKLEFTLTQDEQSAQVSLEIEPSSSSISRTASGKVTINQSSSDSQTFEVNGTAQASGSVVSSVSVQSSDASLSLSCETISQEVAAARLDSTSSDFSDQSDSGDSGFADALSELPGENGEGYGTGPNGESNFIPLDQVDGVEVVN